jgi:hypothetical protein
MLLLTTQPTMGQLVDRRPEWNWRDRVPDRINGRRNVTIWIDDPPAGAPVNYRQAVQDAIDAWNNAENYPGGVQLKPAANADAADIRVRWRDTHEGPFGVTSPRRRVEGRLGQMTVEIRTRRGDVSNRPFLDAQQIENIARHELGHAMGLTHNPGSSVMRPEARKANLRDADWAIGHVDIGAKRNLYFVPRVGWDRIRPLIDNTFARFQQVPDGFLYTYTVIHDAGSNSPVDTFGIFTLASMVDVHLPDGWHAEFFPPMFEPDSEWHTHAPGLMIVRADPGFELAPGETTEFVFFSRGEPTNGWVYAMSIEEFGLTELGANLNIWTPIPEPGSLSALVLGMLSLLGCRRRNRA